MVKTQSSWRKNEKTIDGPDRLFPDAFLSSSSALASEMKEWTVLVFLNGHNNLDSFGLMNINQMIQVGSSDQVNVVVQWASKKNGHTKRIYINKGSYEVIQDMPQVDMGNYKNLVDFANWAQQKYPAKKYLVDVWNHGNGWHIMDGVFGNSSVHTNDISFDDTTGHSIKTEELGRAMGEIAQLTGGKVELYASDACLMAMAEVAAEMTNSVKYFAGSQEVEPGEGWPYTTFLAGLVDHPSMDGGGVAKLLSREYKAAYSGGVYGQKTVTFSAWDLSKMTSFYDAVKNLAGQLKALDTPSCKWRVERSIALKLFS